MDEGLTSVFYTPKLHYPSTPKDDTELHDWRESNGFFKDA